MFKEDYAGGEMINPANFKGVVDLPGETTGKDFMNKFMSRSRDYERECEADKPINF